jgi:hypothetical protein
VRTVRALAAAHGRGSLNATLRDAGPWVTTLAVTGTAALVLVTLGAFGAGFWGLGFLLAAGPLPELLSAAAWLFTLVPFAAALASMLGAEARTLNWDALRPYPVAPLALFTAEVIASVAQLMMFVGLWSMLAFTGGAALGPQPVLALLCPRLLAAVVVMLSLHSLLGTVAGWVVRRLRNVLLLLVIVAPVPVLAMLADPALARRLAALGTHLGELTPYLPAGWGLELGGPLSWAKQGAGLGLFGLFALALLWLAYRLATHEVEPTQSVTAKPERLWSHASRVVSLARVTLVSILASDLGRLQVMTPVLFALPIIVLRVKLSMLAMVRSDLIFFSVCVMTPTMLFNLSLNQFGTDRGAVKALLLLPIAPRELLLGKALGLLVVLLANLAVLAPIVIVMARPPLWSWPTALLAGASLFLIGLTVGQFTSIAWPRPVPRKGLRQPPGGALMGAVSLVLLLGVTAPVALVAFWLRDEPQLLTALMLGVLGAACSLFYGGLQLAERFFLSRSERLVESL